MSQTSVPGRPDVLKAGTLLQSRYRIVGVLGAGGMSTVYHARDQRFPGVDRSCAIKEMFNRGEDGKRRHVRLANFQREAAILATLHHPAIPTIYDYFEIDGTVYLVIELVRGRDLEALLDQRGDPFPEATVIEWALVVTNVLEYLHAQEPEPVIFRDLKPSNIMIRSEDRAVMLIDFGIARAMTPAVRATMIGTEGYAPPEQYRGVVDARGDIYALGATIHHLVTGSDPRIETPFTFDQRPPRKLNREVSEEFDALIMRCLAYEPEGRFQTASELANALRRVAGRASAAIPSALPNSVANRPQPLQVPNQERPSEYPRRSPCPPVDRLAWTLTTGDEIRGSASFAGGAVYVGSYDRQFYAIDETDGGVRWRFTAQRGIVSRPAISNDLVVLGSEDRYVYALARQTGRIVWNFRTNMPVRSSPFADDRHCIIGSDDGTLYALRREDGFAAWRYACWGPVRSSPAATEDVVLVGSDDGYLHCLDRNTGAPIWRRGMGGPMMSSPVIVGDQVVAGANDGAVRGLSLRDGTVRWAVQTGKAVIATPAIEDGTAYVGSADGSIYAIDTTLGRPLWQSSICRQVTSSAAIDGDVLYVGGADANLHCLDRHSGQELWTFTTGSPVVSRPLITTDHVVFGSLDGKLYALHRDL